MALYESENRDMPIPLQRRSHARWNGKFEFLE